MQTTLVATVVGVLASACATKSGTGAAVGATGGGLIGAAVGGVPGLIVGAAAGGVLGYTAGRAMEEDDRQRVAAALEADRAARWTNPHTGYRYDVRPTGNSTENGRPCREFQMRADMGRDTQDVHGVACQQPDGRWELVGSG
jgi:surface antigen